LLAEVKNRARNADHPSMTSRERFGALWNRDGLPPAVRSLALITLAGGLSGLFAAAFPASPAAPVDLLRIIGVVALCASLLLWWFGDRLPRWSLHVAVVGGTLLISVLIARSASGVGMIVTACDYMWMGVYAAFFFSRAAARAHTAVIAAAFAAALLASPHHVPADAWVFLTASLVVATETIGRQSSRLRHEAHTDSLTGLLNRNGLAPAAERALALADRTGIPLTVALIDLDDFKQVNDRDGHAEGDRLLVQMTRTWSEELQPGDIFARLGGDEFLVILVGSDDEEAKRLFELLLFVSPTQWSAGVIKRRTGEDLHACLARADNALYESKRSRLVPWEPADPVSAPAPQAQLEPTR
jgi:diguanylate cyclase (GGDEF)-like protein